jgi:hypothetical protein
MKGTEAVGQASRSYSPLRWSAMPAIAEFQGITLFIYYPPREHPPPHFHAIYGDQGRVELMDCWNRAIAGQRPGRIG